LLLITHASLPLNLNLNILPALHATMSPEAPVYSIELVAFQPLHHHGLHFLTAALQSAVQHRYPIPCITLSTSLSVLLLGEGLKHVSTALP